MRLTLCIINHLLHTSVLRRAPRVVNLVRPHLLRGVLRVDRRRVALQREAEAVERAPAVLLVRRPRLALAGRVAIEYELALAARAELGLRALAAKVAHTRAATFLQAGPRGRLVQPERLPLHLRRGIKYHRRNTSALERIAALLGRASHCLAVRRALARRSQVLSALRR